MSGIQNWQSNVPGKHNEPRASIKLFSVEPCESKMSFHSNTIYLLGSFLRTPKINKSPNVAFHKRQMAFLSSFASIYFYKTWIFTMPFQQQCELLFLNQSFALSLLLGDKTSTVGCQQPLSCGSEESLSTFPNAAAFSTPLSHSLHFLTTVSSTSPSSSSYSTSSYLY